MKCPKCKVEMQEGTLNNGVIWVQGSREESLKSTTSPSTGTYVRAWRCPLCGKVELDTEAELHF